MLHCVRQYERDITCRAVCVLSTCMNHTVSSERAHRTYRSGYTRINFRFLRTVDVYNFVQYDSCV